MKAYNKRGIIFLMQGFGVGCSPIIPGTCGTLLAIPIYLIFYPLPFHIYFSIILILWIVGIYGCQLASTELQVHDAPSLVWDEMVGFLVAMTGIFPSIKTIILGFLLFRLFDILKPWPISWVDKNVKNGLGIMLDDVLAGVCTNLILSSLFYRKGYIFIQFA